MNLLCLFLLCWLVSQHVLLAFSAVCKICSIFRLCCWYIFLGQGLGLDPLNSLLHFYFLFYSNTPPTPSLSVSDFYRYFQKLQSVCLVWRWKHRTCISIHQTWVCHVCFPISFSEFLAFQFWENRFLLEHHTGSWFTAVVTQLQREIHFSSYTMSLFCHVILAFFYFIVAMAWII
jgi:hypothetical protein